MKASIAGTLLTGCIALAFIWSHRASGTDQVPEYWFSPDPGLELVHLRFSGGRSKARLDYRLLADGTLKIEHRANEDGGDTYSSFTHHVTSQELDALIRKAVAGGLLTISNETRTKIRNLERQYSSSDSGSMWLTLAIPHVRLPGAREETSVRATLAMAAGTYQRAATRAREVPELAAIEELVATLRAYEKQARAAQ